MKAGAPWSAGFFHIPGQIKNIHTFLYTISTFFCYNNITINPTKMAKGNAKQKREKKKPKQNKKK